MRVKHCAVFLLIQAVILIASGCMPYAPVEPERFAAFSQDDPYAYIASARKYLMRYFNGEGSPLRNLNTVIQEAETAVSLAPTIGDAYYFLGFATAMKGVSGNYVPRIKEGLGYYRKAMELNPSLKKNGILPPLAFFVVRFSNAPDFFSEKKINWHISLLKEAIAQKPDFSDAHQLLSHLYAVQGKSFLAVQEASTAAKLDPRNPEKHKLLALMYSSFSDARDEKIYKSAAEKGVEALKTAISLQPDDDGSHKALAVFYGTLGRNNLKLFEARTALGLKDSAENRYELASVYLSECALDRAEAEFRAGMGLKKETSSILVAFCQYLREDYRGACQMLDGYDFPKDDAYDALWYYFSLMGNGQQSKATAFLINFHFRFKGNDWGKALLAYAKGDLSEPSLIELAKQRFDLCEAYFYIACNAWHNGDIEKARQFYVKTLETKIFDYYEYYGANYRLKITLKENV